MQFIYLHMIMNKTKSMFHIFILGTPILIGLNQGCATICRTDCISQVPKYHTWQTNFLLFCSDQRNFKRSKWRIFSRRINRYYGTLRCWEIDFAKCFSCVHVRIIFNKKSIKFLFLPIIRRKLKTCKNTSFPKTKAWNARFLPKIQKNHWTFWPFQCEITEWPILSTVFMFLLFFFKLPREISLENLDMRRLQRNNHFLEINYVLLTRFWIIIRLIWALNFAVNVIFLLLL